MSRNIDINPKRFLSGLLAMLLIFLAVVPVPARAADISDYEDAQEHWAYDALVWAVNEGVVVGTSETRIDPDGYLTRAQMAAIVKLVEKRWRN